MNTETRNENKVTQRSTRTYHGSKVVMTSLAAQQHTVENNIKGVICEGEGVMVQGDAAATQTTFNPAPSARREVLTVIK